MVSASAVRDSGLGGPYGRRRYAAPAAETPSEPQAAPSGPAKAQSVPPDAPAVEGAQPPAGTKTIEALLAWVHEPNAEAEVTARAEAVLDLEQARATAQRPTLIAALEDLLTAPVDPG